MADPERPYIVGRLILAIQMGFFDEKSEFAGRLVLWVSNTVRALRVEYAAARPLEIA